MKVKKCSCKRIEKMIPVYLAGSMSNSDLVLFMNHIDTCMNCKEELAIQFLTTEALNTLEFGESYDLQKAFDEKLSRTHKYIDVVKKLFWVRNIAFVIVIIALIVCLYLGYRFVLS